MPFDLMPERVEPHLALLKRKPPRGPDWSYEIKWDGYRLAVHIEPTGVRIITRGGLDWTHRFPAIADAAKALGQTTMILAARRSCSTSKAGTSFRTHSAHLENRAASMWGFNA